MTSYLDNYNKIAQHHIAHAHANNGDNPFQSAAQVETLEHATEQLVRRYVTPGSLILDAGCGTGSLLARLDGYQRVGLDLSRDYLAYASQGANPNTTLVLSDIEHIPSTWHEPFDAVICADVLEHILHPDVAINELVRVLKPGGHLIIRVPDSEDLSVYTDLPQEYEYVHLRRFDRPSLILWLSKVHELRILEAPTVSHDAWHEIHAVCQKP